MIFNRRIQRKQRLSTLLLIGTIAVGLLFIVIRQLTLNLITDPLEIRAEIQVNGLLSANNIDLSSYVDVAKLSEITTDEEELIDVALLKGSNLVWQDFNEPIRLQLLRDEIPWQKLNQTNSHRHLTGYSITVPFEYQNDNYFLLKYYPRSLFQEIRNNMTLWFLGLVAIFLLFGLWVYYLNKSIIDQPIQAILEGVQEIRKESYQFEYVGHRQEGIDELGYAVANLSKKLANHQENFENNSLKLSLLLDHLNLGVLLINQASQIELINPEARKLLDIDIKRLNQSYQLAIRSYTLVRMINQVLTSHRPLSNEIEIFSPTSKHLDVKIIPFGQSSEMIESILVLLYDISEIRRLETIRTEFVANASHELRTPVTAIKGFAETLLDGAMLTPDIAQKFITIIANESNRLEVIINDILELSRVEKQSEPLTKTSFDIVESTHHLKNFLHKKASDKRIDISIIAEKPIIINADQHRVEQIITNLIDNAINYSNADSEIVISVYQVNNDLEFSVADSGIGIPEADQERVFERFYRVDKGRSRNSGGTGLGLAIVRNLVKIMNGSIRLESELGKGTTFYVRLP